mmetsp:Transcript_54039/g.94924  ORF Transcript_54039/g.94924 Transcript_54039/m.94924 type:complete len:260 (-) Transcript_54039:140-919(-)
MSDVPSNGDSGPESAAAAAGEFLTKLAKVLDAVAAAEGKLISDDDKRIADARFNLGDALWSQENDAEGAISEFCAALAKNPRHVDSLCGLGSVLGELGDVPAAIKAFRRALAIAPRHGIAHFYLGSALGRRGDFDGAVMEYSAVLEYEPNSQVATLARANLQAAARVTADLPLTYERGMPLKAIEQLEKFTWDDDRQSAAEASCSSCAICMKDFAIGDEVRKLPCGHVFHVACIDEWLRRCVDCPLCKADANVLPATAA